MNRTRVFLSFDRENDSDLGKLLRMQSEGSSGAIEVMKNCCRRMSHRDWATDASGEIRAAEVVLVICGEHTDECDRVSRELAIAQDEGKPYMLLWGRRDKMCTKPESARNTDAMFSWTREILEAQISATIRGAKPVVVPEECKRPQKRAPSDPAASTVPADESS